MSGPANSRRVVLATRNPGKVAELRRILTGRIDVHLVGLEHFPGVGDIAETGSTFVENALIKATAVAAATGLTAIADDSGLCVDALNGMPGVLSARWAGRHGDDLANLRLVLDQLADVPRDRRGAHFACAAAAVAPGRGERVAEATLEGYLLDRPQGSHGFGYDPVFVPGGGSRTTAELSAAEKDAISHRGKAFSTLVPLLAELLD
ncbi:MAG: RdgB/HAM1 family non-canonical purine NTP pyrophosphatase [Actinomycetota bacterium]|nr:RdgB/HAM1 family non-canonical purine NTP pyrophosphatase [Actinomycetota bacterium]